MNAQQEVKNAQKAWAESKGIPFGTSGYVRDVEINLRGCLSAHARAGYEKGDGNELEGHMKALHSSSVLVANVFDYWTDRDKVPLLQALDIKAAGAKSLDFEAKFPTEVSVERGSNPPNLDVAITLDSDCVIAIESKFIEWMSRSTKGKSDFKPAYFPESGERWTEKGLPACQAFAEELRAEELRGGRQQFEHLA